MKLTNRTFVLTALFATSISLFYACSKNATVATPSQPRVSSVSSTNANSFIDPANMCGTAQEVPLTAGQSIPAGSVTIQNDPDNVYVTYTATNGWKFTELHLSLDCNTNGDCTVQKSSDVAPGKFPYKAVFSAGTTLPCDPNSALPTTYTFTIPRSTLGDCSCFCVYPHAAVIKCNGSSVVDSQTAWGGNVMQITNGKWYGGTNYCLQTCGSDTK